jgi:hypothetical protein
MGQKPNSPNCGRSQLVPQHGQGPGVPISFNHLLPVVRLCLWSARDLGLRWGMVVGIKADPDPRFMSSRRRGRQATMTQESCPCPYAYRRIAITVDNPGMILHMFIWCA